MRGGGDGENRGGRLVRKRERERGGGESKGEGKRDLFSLWIISDSRR
jgi:hypothetical protein